MLGLLRGDEMRRQMERNPSIRGSVGPERMFSIFQDISNLILAQFDAHHRQPASEVGFDHCSDARKLRLPMMGCDFVGRDPSFRKQRRQILAIAEHEWRTQRRIKRDLPRPGPSPVAVT